jgi:hypothetical protein
LGRFLVARGKEEMWICMTITDNGKGVGFNPKSTYQGILYESRIY